MTGWLVFLLLVHVAAFAALLPSTVHRPRHAAPIGG